MPLGDVFTALGDPTRRRILHMLAEQGDLSAGEIADAFDMTKPSISHHLATLAQAGLVARRRDGRRIIYSLDVTVIHEALGWIYDVMDRRRAGVGRDERRKPE